jgi:heptosyltransferase-2
MAAMKVPLSSTEPDLQVPTALLTAVAEEICAIRSPLDRNRDGRLTSRQGLAGHELVRASVRAADAWHGLSGGWAEKLVSAFGSGQIVNACGLRLIEAAALLRLADLFIGPSSGPLNLAAAGGTEAFGLFGSTPVLTYSKFIRAIVPEGGPSPGGMARIAAAQVLERIAPYLSRRKGPA